MKRPRIIIVGVGLAAQAAAGGIAAASASGSPPATGQGVQNFFVAAPGIASITMPAGRTAPTTPAVPPGGYGY